MPIATSGFNRSFRVGVRPYVLSQTQIVNSAQIWYKADTNAYFNPSNLNSGTGITQWNDSSSAAHNASPSGAGTSVRPTWFSNIQNSFGALQFTGTAQNLQISNVGTWGANLPGFTLVVVAKATALSSGTTYYITNSDQSGFSIYWNGTYWVTRTAGGTGTSSITGDTTNFHIFAQIFDASNQSASNDIKLKFRYNKAPVPLTWGGTTVGNTTSASTSKLNFGWDGTGNYFNGYIAEVMMWTSAKDSSFVQAVETYLSQKWNI